MITKYNDSNGLGNYIIINNEKKYITQEECDLIDKGYSYNIDLGLFEESPESIEFEKQILENKKTSLLKEIGELKQIKDGMELVGDDTTEITAKITDLVSEYKIL